MYVPIWMICLLSAPGAMLGSRRCIGRFMRRRRAKRGLCLACGYDVRHSQNRCPECGQPTSRPARCRLTL
jgi:predicted amidophosphoribosyltransferase